MINDTSAASHRWEQILQELLRHGEVSVDSLAKNFKVSSATIRRDLSELERQGLRRRNHGCAHPVTPMIYEPFRNLSSFQEQEQKCAAEKRRIGLTAASLRWRNRGHRRGHDHYSVGALHSSSQRDHHCYCRAKRMLVYNENARASSAL